MTVDNCCTHTLAASWFAQRCYWVTEFKFLVLFTSYFTRSKTFIHKMGTQLLIGTAICYSTRDLSDVVPVDDIWTRSYPVKSILQASHKLWIPCLVVHIVMHYWVKLMPHKLQLLLIVQDFDLSLIWLLTFSVR